MEWPYFLGGLLVAGILLWLLGRSVDADDAAFRANGLKAQGLVVKNVLELSDASTFRPLVRFTTQKGEVILAEDTQGVAFAVPRFAAGSTVNLIYNPHDPHDFRIVSPGAMR